MHMHTLFIYGDQTLTLNGKWGAQQFGSRLQTKLGALIKARIRDHHT